MAGETVREVNPVAQTERIGLGDLILAALLAVGTFVFQWLCEFPGLYPGVWDEAAVALGVRPAAQVMPGYWTALATVLHRFLDIEQFSAALRLIGHLSLAAIAVGVYVVIREILAFIMRIRPQSSRRRTLVSQLASALGAVAFVASDPVWALGQCLCEETILVLLTVAALEFFFAFLRKGAIRYAYCCAILLGVLAAESLLGFVLPVVLIALYVSVVKRCPQIESPFFEPSVFEVGKWHMTFLFLVALLVGVGLNVYGFVTHHGLGAAGQSLGDLPLAYALCYWQRLASAATPVAWAVLFAVFVVPFVVTAIRFPTASDEAQFLPYATGLVFFVCGMLVYSQFVALPALWAWTYFPVSSGYLLTFGILLGALTLSGAVTILGVDACCRDHRKLAADLFGVGDDDEDEHRMSRLTRVSASRTTVFVRRLGLVVVPVFLLLTILPGRIKTTTRLMLGIVHEAVTEMVREAGDAKILFSDGNLDAVLEIESARQGGKLTCHSLMGGATPMDAFLRLRGLEDAEDRFSFGFDTGMGLRSWIRDKPERLKLAAAQMGFDLWKRDGKALPPMGGLLSRPTGFPDEEERRRGVAEAHRLADRILAVYMRRMGVNACTEKPVRKAFLDVQWRIARMCKYRGEADDLAGHAEAAIAEATLAKRLNDLNATYQSVVRAVEKRNDQLLQKMTPREGLQLALVRADFRMGRAYAETILSADPENPDANFAMGMFYHGERQLSRAEEYLRRCLVRKPNEPAVYNNLAMIQIEQGKFRAAAANVKRALELLPDSAAVQETRKALVEAIRKEKDRKDAAARKPVAAK